MGTRPAADGIKPQSGPIDGARAASRRSCPHPFTHTAIRGDATRENAVR